MSLPSGSQAVSSTGALSVARLFQDHAAFAWRALRHLGVPEADAEDVCQEVFVVVHRKLPEFEGRSSPRTWIYGICVRVARDYRRRAHVRYEQSTPEPPQRVSSENQEHKLHQSQAWQALERALSALDSDKRAVFVLYEIEGLSMKEVAEALGCPVQTAYSRLHAARESVLAYMRRFHGDGR